MGSADCGPAERGSLQLGNKTALLSHEKTNDLAVLKRKSRGTNQTWVAFTSPSALFKTVEL